jgi:hypothetical protein
MTASQVQPKIFFDQAYLEQKSHLQLFLHLSKHYLNALYYSASDRQYVGFEEHYLGENEQWATVLEPLRMALSELPKEAKKVSLNFSTPIYTHIPAALYQDESACDYLLLNHRAPVKPTELVSNKVGSLSLVVAFEIPFLVQNAIQAHFLNFSGIYHESTSLLEYCSAQKPWMIDKVYLNVEHEHFHLIHFSSQGLNFFNQFSYKTVEDFMYYFLYTLEQLALDREQLDLHVFGLIQEDSSLFKMLHQYIRNVKLIARPKQVLESKLLGQIGQSAYFNFFNHYLCES